MQSEAMMVCLKVRMDIGSQASASHVGTGGVAFKDGGTTKCGGRRRERKRLPLAALIEARGVKRKPRYAAPR